LFIEKFEEQDIGQNRGLGSLSHARQDLAP